MQDVDISIGLFASATVVAAGYGLRMLASGGARYDRIDRAASSRLLGKRVMAGGYWAMQPVGKALGAMGISPNSITWASLAFAGAGAVAFAQGHFGLGALLSLMGTLCDCFDGMVARAMGTASDAGEVLDAAIDRASDFLFLAGVAYFYKDRPAFFACAMLALLGSFLVSYATAKAEALQIDVPGGQMRRPERATYLLLGAAMMPISMTYIEPRFFGTVVGLPMALVVGFVGLVSISSSMRRFAAMIDALHARDARRSSMSSVVNEDSGEHLIPSQTAEVAE